jgi:hypothetical protein
MPRMRGVQTLQVCSEKIMISRSCKCIDQWIELTSAGTAVLRQASTI